MRTFLLSVAVMGCGVSTVETTDEARVDSTRSLQTGRFVKVSTAGQAVDETARLGTGPDEWACTWDAQTGLLWEMKTTDGSVHDARWAFSWFEPGTSSSVPGWPGPAGCGPARCETRSLRDATNLEGLCGVREWRLPRRAELEALVVCRAGRYHGDDDWVRGFPCADFRTDSSPKLEVAFFPNLDTTNVNSSTYFQWTDESYSVLPEYAYYVNFRTGGSDRVFKSERRGARLVSPATRPSPRPHRGPVLSFEGTSDTRRTFPLSGPRRVALNLDVAGRPRWFYRSAGGTTWSEIACEPDVATRCAFTIPAWAALGTYELVVELGQSEWSNQLTADLVP